MTSNDRSRIDEEMSAIRTSVVTLNHRLKDLDRSQQDGNLTAGKKFASAESSLEQTNAYIAEIRGEIDRLQLGVRLGHLPGNPSDQDSVAKSLARLKQRISALEVAQVETLELIEKIGKVKGRKRRPRLTTSKQVSSAFSKKQYLYITEDSPGLIERLKGSEAERVRFLYAESLFKIGSLTEAAFEFKALSELKGRASRQPKVTLRLGDCFRLLGNHKTGLIFYSELVEKYPSSSEAELARGYIKKYGS